MTYQELIKFIELKIKYHKSLDNVVVVQELNEILYVVECLAEESEEPSTESIVRELRGIKHHLDEMTNPALESNQRRY